MKPEVLQETEAELWQTWHEIQEAIATRNFQPKTGRLCDWCSYKDICPAFKHPSKAVKAKPTK
jgi:putative RecB family exonuclease